MITANESIPSFIRSITLFRNGIILGQESQDYGGVGGETVTGVSKTDTQVSILQYISVLLSFVKS